jgi:hypothetical protein
MEYQDRPGVVVSMLRMIKRVARVRRIARAEGITPEEVNDTANLLAQGSRMTTDEVLERAEKIGIQAVMDEIGASPVARG